MVTRKRPEKETESSSQLQTATTSKAVIEVLLEQQDDAASEAAGAVSPSKRQPRLQCELTIRLQHRKRPRP